MEMLRPILYSKYTLTNELRSLHTSFINDGATVLAAICGRSALRLLSVDQERHMETAVPKYLPLNIVVPIKEFK